jgi:hydrogenase expression/formation protein HypC
MSLKLLLSLSDLNQGFFIMCLAIPSKIVKIENNVATIDVDGVRREASLLLIDDPKIGDYVIVHAGFAINKINEEQALESLKLMKEAASLIFDNDKQK